MRKFLSVLLCTSSIVSVYASDTDQAIQLSKRTAQADQDFDRATDQAIQLSKRTHLEDLAVDWAKQNSIQTRDNELFLQRKDEENLQKAISASLADTLVRTPKEVLSPEPLPAEHTQRNKLIGDAADSQDDNIFSTTRVNNVTNPGMQTVIGKPAAEMEEEIIFVNKKGKKNLPKITDPNFFDPPNSAYDRSSNSLEQLQEMAGDYDVLSDKLNKLLNKELDEQEKRQ
jgi:hypothetical protein